MRNLAKRIRTKRPFHFEFLGKKVNVVFFLEKDGDMGDCEIQEHMESDKKGIIKIRINKFYLAKISNEEIVRMFLHELLHALFKIKKLGNIFETSHSLEEAVCYGAEDVYSKMLQLNIDLGGNK